MKKTRLLALLAIMALPLVSCGGNDASNNNNGNNNNPSEPGEPSNPGDDPVDPGVDPVDPGDDPANPGDDPADPGDDPVDPGDDPVEGEWSKEVQEFMMTAFGELLPYAALNQDTMYYYLDDTYAEYGIYDVIIGDDNETNVLTDYDQKLIDAGYTPTEYGTSGIFYDKTTANGLEVSLSYGYYDANGETPAGNEIDVQFIYTEPEEEDPINIDELEEKGYTKVTGWPSDQIDFVLADSGHVINGVNLEGVWYYYSGTETNSAGTYQYTHLVCEGDFTQDFVASIENTGFSYDESTESYFSSDDAIQIEVELNNGNTSIYVFGDYIKEDIVSEDIDDDGNLVVTLQFADALQDGTIFEGDEAIGNDAIQFVPAYGSNKNNAPKYYDNGSTLRFYYGNTMTFTATEGYEILKVELNVGSKKDLTPASDISANKGTFSFADDVATISDVNSDELVVTIGAGKTKGNIGFSSVVITLAEVEI